MILESLTVCVEKIRRLFSGMGRTGVLLVRCWIIVEAAVVGAGDDREGDRLQAGSLLTTVTANSIETAS